jgi:GAF domain-containing protein
MSLLKSLNPSYIPEHLHNKSTLEIQREIILQHVLNAVTAFGILGLVVYLIKTPINSHNYYLLSPFVMTIVMMTIVTLIRKLPFGVRGGTMAILLGVEFIEKVVREGLVGTGAIYAMVVILVMTLLAGKRGGVISIVGSILVYTLTGLAMNYGYLPQPNPMTVANVLNPFNWINMVMAFVLATATTVGVMNQLSGGLNKALIEQKNLNIQLDEERVSLETRIKQRTQELSNKTSALEAARRISSVFSTESDLQELLKKTAAAIHNQLGFYLTSVFLNDDAHEFTVLRAANGEADQQMLDEGYQLKIGESGIVGTVAGKGTPAVSNNVATNPFYIANPMLPDTQSELAIPLKSGDQIIGVLDIQSAQADTFDQDRIEILMTIADQLSLAIDKTRLLQELKQSVTDLEQINRVSTQKNWDSHLMSAQRNYSFSSRGLSGDAISFHTEESLLALQNGHTITSVDPLSLAKDQTSSIVAVPIKIRNQPIGVVNMRMTGSRVDPELLEMVEGAVNRLAASLENARLLEELQFRAERERMVGTIASKVHAASDVESILRIAANELGRSLGISEVVVQLNSNK